MTLIAIRIQNIFENILVMSSKSETYIFVIIEVMLIVVQKIIVYKRYSWINDVT